MTKRQEQQIKMYGANTLPTQDLLTYILGSGTCASELLKIFDLSQLQSVDWADLMHIAGLSEAQALHLAAICELARRLTSTPPERSVNVRETADAVALLRPMMINLSHERLYVLAIDSELNVVSCILLYKGTVWHCDIRPAEVFRVAIARGCPYIILAHNHPSGLAEPSQNDIDITKDLIEAGKLVGIELLDHVVIGNPRWASIMKKLKEP